MYTTDREFVVWEARYTLGISVIDDQHKELLNLTNELFSACRQGNEVEAIFKEVIHKSVEYVKFHFSTEEKILEQINYPEISAHKKEHEGFIIKVIADVKSFESGKSFVPNAFARYLREWILAHIAVSDKKYAEYAMRLKKEGKLNIEI